MPWQDIVIALGAAALAFALLPTLLGEEKPALSTCLLTGGVLVVFAVTFATLGLWFAAAVDVVTAALWFAIGVQVMRRHRARQAQASASALREQVSQS